MNLVVQRVSEAAVAVDGEEIARIGPGLLVLVGVEDGDGDAQAAALAGKVARLRVFPDASKPMNRSVTDTGGAVLVVSQFTLAADHAKGNRPSFIRAAAPAEAQRLYLAFAAALADRGVPVELGRFGAMMDVALVNQGPATFILRAPPA